MMSIAAARQIIESSVKPVFIIFDEKRGCFYGGGLWWERSESAALRYMTEAGATTARDEIERQKGCRCPEILVLPVLP